MTEAAVRDALLAIKLGSGEAFTWFGRRYRPMRPRRQRRPATTRGANLIDGVKEVLYQNFYTRGFASSEERRVPPAPRSGIGNFLDTLSAANQGHGFQEDGWQLAERHGDEALLRRRGLCISVSAAELAKLREGDGGRSLHVTKESPALLPGYYVAFGDRALDDESPLGLIRLYWNLTPDAAVSLIRHATSLLNSAGIAFTLKVLEDPAGYTRCDSGVLYAQRSDYARLAPALEDIHARVSDDLRERIPIFTKRLAHGLGLAEDPGGGQSFGLHRCRILAEGIVRAHREGHRLSDRLDIIAGIFDAAGISLEHAYLNPGSADSYAALSRRPAPGLIKRARQDESPASSEDFLDVAVGIGAHLCRTAVWYGDRCTWCGPEILLSPEHRGGSAWTWKPLAADLYGGTSGIALFLATLYGQTGSPQLREAALGALRRALAAVDTVPDSVRLGLFCGLPGIAFAAVRVGLLLDEPQLVATGQQLLRDCLSETAGPDEYDLLNGQAGALVAALAVAGEVGDQSLLQAAVRLGDVLRATAIPSGDGYAWRSGLRPDEPPLTGFSHGASGVAWALLELYHATGRGDYRSSAEAAIAYERGLFDAGAGNWPDLRDQRATSRARRRYMIAWCHGAPGIVLSRLRAYEITGDSGYRVEALAGAKTTRDSLQESLAEPADDLSLCHGLFGNAEALLEAERAVAPGWDGATSFSLKAAAYGISRYAKQTAEWPCGVGAKGAPGLMRGLAGIGYFYLRLSNPSIPSILLPAPANEKEANSAHDRRPAGGIKMERSSASSSSGAAKGPSR